jgi:hypothetical protein
VHTRNGREEKVATRLAVPFVEDFIVEGEAPPCNIRERRGWILDDKTN